MIETLYSDPRNVVSTLAGMLPGSPQNAIARRDFMLSLTPEERAGFVSHVQNAAAVNTIDASLKRIAILQETIRDFATRVLPLRLFATRFENVPLQGTDTVAVPY